MTEPTRPAEVSALDRAADLMRSESPAAGWIDITEAVRDRLRRLAGPGRRLRIEDPKVTDGGRTWVSEWVVRDALRGVLTTGDADPERIDLEIEDDQLVAVRLALVVAFGRVLTDVAERARADVLGSLAGLLGPTRSSVPVDVEIVDVETRD